MLHSSKYTTEDAGFRWCFFAFLIAYFLCIRYNDYNRNSNMIRYFVLDFPIRFTGNSDSKEAFS